MKVTVIIPVYNVEKYLSECIDSIIAQTYKNLEIILVDDGSTDNSPVICDEYAAKDDRIKVIHKQNGGVSSARNTALDIMTGDYCCFVDGDDVISIHFVEFLLDICTTYNCDISCCGYSKFKISDEIDVSSLPEMDKKILIFENHDGIKKYCSGWIHPSMCNKMYKSKCFEGLRFLPVKIAEDLAMTFELLFKGFKICSMKHYPLYYYRMSPNSAMRSTINHSVIEDLNIRMEVYSRICQYDDLQKSAKEFSNDTKNLFTDSVIRIRFSDENFKPLIKEMKICRDKLHREMFLPEAKNLSEKFDCFLMKLSLRMYRLYKLVQVKVFKIQIYK